MQGKLVLEHHGGTVLGATLNGQKLSRGPLELKLLGLLARAEGQLVPDRVLMEELQVTGEELEQVSGRLRREMTRAGGRGNLERLSGGEE
jgi:DNA-binding response OmpR family regulator